MDVINRSVMVIKPLEPYYDWITTLAGPINPTKEMMEASVLLIPDHIYPSGIEAYIRHVFAHVFTIQLESLSPDVNEWPQGRDYALFRQWFHVDVHPLVLDAVAEDIRKEPY